MGEMGEFFRYLSGISRVSIDFLSSIILLTIYS